MQEYVIAVTNFGLVRRGMHGGVYKGRFPSYQLLETREKIVVHFGLYGERA